MTTEDSKIAELGLNADVLLDIGARNGESVVRFRSLFPEATILSFEPRPDAVAQLRRVAAFDGNTHVFPVALGSAPGFSEMYEFPKADASSSILPPTEGMKESRPWANDWRRVAVSVCCLDDIFDPMRAQRLFIKVDVQGYEEHVIRGGMVAFAHARACVIEIENEPLYEGAAQFETIDRILNYVGLSYRGASRTIYKKGKKSWADHVWTKRK